METLAYRKNAGMVRRARRTEPPVTGRENARCASTRSPTTKSRSGTISCAWARRRSRVLLPLFWVNFQLSGLEAALPEELLFRSRRDAGVNLTGSRNSNLNFKSDSCSSCPRAPPAEIILSERHVQRFRAAHLEGYKGCERWASKPLRRGGRSAWDEGIRRRFLRTLRASRRA